MAGLPPSFIGNPGNKGGPSGPAWFGSGGGATIYGGRGGGGGGQRAGIAQPRKRPLDEVSVAPTPEPPPAAAYMPRPGGPPAFHGPNAFINPYRGIEGFDDYQNELLKIRGDQIGKVGIQNYPAARGFPSRDRVTQISEAMQRLGAMPAAPARAMGTGVGQGGPDDIIKRLLRERMYGAGTKGAM